LILQAPIEHPPGDAEISLAIDGNASCWRVHLQEGISPARLRTRISRSRVS
jgi:hypothetical protein